MLEKIQIWNFHGLLIRTWKVTTILKTTSAVLSHCYYYNPYYPAISSCLYRPKKSSSGSKKGRKQVCSQKGHVRNRVTGSGGELKVTQGPGSGEWTAHTEQGNRSQRNVYCSQKNTIATWMDLKLGAQWGKWEMGKWESDIKENKDEEPEKRKRKREISMPEDILYMHTKFRHNMCL